MTKEEEEYLNLYSFNKINSFVSIADKEENIKDAEEAKNKYKNIDRYIGIKINIKFNLDLTDDSSEKQAKKLKQKLQPEIDEIQELSTRFKGQRREDFNNGLKAFYSWFKNQKEECFYCKTQKNELKDIFNKKVITSKKFTSKLHIERKDSKGKYIVGNMVLACALCNNAKSDMISEKDYKKYFAKSMEKYLSKCKNEANAST